MIFLICRQLCRILNWLFFRRTVIGLEHVPHSGGVLILSNHQSYFDPVIVGIPIRRATHFMARDTLFTNRWFGKLIYGCHAFPVKRGQADMSAIKESLRRLKGGSALCAFPEGTRSIDGRIGEWKAGLIAIARKANVPIVPVVVEGMIELWPRDQKWPRLRGQYWIQYAPPILPDALHEDLDQAAMEMTHYVRRLHNQLRQKIGRDAISYDPSPVPTINIAEPIR